MSGDARATAGLGRVLLGTTIVAMAAMAVGVVLMLAAGIDPGHAPAAPLDPGALPAALIAGDAAAWLWLGILGIAAQPLVRLVIELFVHLGTGDRRAAAVAGVVLGVVVIGIMVAITVTPEA